MTKKLLMISQNFYPELGSAANRMKMMFKAFRSSGSDPTMLTTEPTYPNQSLFEDQSYFTDESLNKLEKKKIIRMKMHGNKQNSNFIMRLVYYIEQYVRLRVFLKMHNDDYDIVYVSSPNIFLAWATLFFKSAKHPTYVLEIRDLWPDSVNGLKHINISLFMPLLKYLEKKMYNSADKIVINNEAFRSHIQKRLQRKVPIFYLPNGISRNELITEEKYNDFSVIYTGNIGYAQDVDKLISICLALNDKQINVTAIVYGVQADKFRKAVRDCKYIQVKKPMDRTACLTEISKHHISLSILESSDVFMNVMPGKIVDAIGVGTPPISNISGPTEAIIQKYNLGFARKQASIDTIVNEIESLKHDEQALSIKAKNAREYRDEHLIWEDNIEKLMTFLRKGDRDDKNL
ncbi:glycosyltransferase family 4 protein [Mammaliicoccus sciuri]|uniref:glycosyltransferase family 4 protein n=2 Tax=Mammaliicoccus sciuri TaxID=1296 RepID=UPI0004722514|nr:glycosyltransferase family 4 protein [Mammaliicoccus sciuri]MCJ0912629.1 glycosyltransferase family 4 protein [Mammaliicoccus sciuri]MCJ0967115.1 glycosyltransferase family 4 protein [Mammaliicoccus sciuri]MDT0669672.1 glycosyltransferase family 4 protein [Mammaliicoccus sciuri]MEB5649982.1 glycosyltransferase family 4 protein [Mammaliicoccus sciuri]MEB6215262.1 glycosyltransferase family 4 protein [Mammaliicoccus sciuri]